MAEVEASRKKVEDQLSIAQKRVVSFFLLLSQICPEGAAPEASDESLPQPVSQESHDEEA